MPHSKLVVISPPLALTVPFNVAELPVLEVAFCVTTVGDMSDMGSNGKKGYRKIGERVAEVVDVLITSGAESALTAKTALDHGMNPDHVHTTYNIQDLNSFVFKPLRK